MEVSVYYCLRHKNCSFDCVCIVQYVAVSIFNLCIIGIFN